MRKIVVLALLVPLVPSSYAEIEPQGIPVGGAALIPTLRIEHEHDDNIFKTPIQEKSSTITRLKPVIQYVAEQNENIFSVSYEGDYGWYWQSSDDDYDDHTLSVFGSYNATDMFTFEGSASTARLHDNRGEGASEGLTALTRGAPDEYDQDNYGVFVDIGRETARFGVSLGYNVTDIQYTNNRAATRFRDREDNALTGRFYGRLAPNTTFFVEYEQTDIEYDNLTTAGVSLDSEEDTVSIGAEWDITGRTTGGVKIGRLNKDFDDGGDDDVTVWDVNVTWAPRTYSVFTFSTSQDARETNGTGAYIEARDISISWLHDWSERLHSTVTLSQGNDEYPGATREDDREFYSVGVNYDWQRWLNMGLSVNFDERDSDGSIFDYDRRSILLHVDVSL